MRILILGAAGQLGSELRSVLGAEHEVIPTARPEADVADLSQLLAIVKRTSPDVIINAAAYTDVDGCETNRDRPFLINALGARNAAIAAREAGAKLVHVSTDYVFDGTKTGPYFEFDPPNPISVYGASKLWGENLVREQWPKHFIVRTAWLYGRTGKNFVKTMLRLAREQKELRVVNDQRGTPTWAADLARQIARLIQTDCYGTYHCTSQGSCTWYQFALAIFKGAGYEAREEPGGSVRLLPPAGLPGPVTVRPVTSEEFPRPARRPKNSVLENYLLQLQGIDIMPPWEEALARFMTEMEREGGER
ncbi:MAG: dTDP-4-dehydrorhamnose reductase [Clostridia bacterium]|jgi:dTDP-4-dehydrorhamnose reductase|nr:dTDP-4-dehydrorhamnose reductase [Clostridia bacterium]